MPKKKKEAPEEKVAPDVNEVTLKRPSVDITCKLAAVIPTGEYQNIQPHYEMSMSVPDTRAGATLDQMRALLQKKIDADHERVRVNKIKQIQKSLRITEKDGKYYPHVTSIQGAINPIDYPEDKLKQYASRGSLVHAQIDNFFRTQVWEEDVLKLPGTKIDYLIVTKGDLGLQWKDCNFMGFYEEYKDKMAVIESECKVFNDQYLYCGTRDLKLRWEGKLSILDWKSWSKTTQDKIDKTFEQLSAYAMCDQEKIEQLIIVPLNPKNKKGYEKPIITTDVDKYFKSFLNDREAFREVYKV